jgi:tetratricopeptide (TPR) repeat protein
VSENNKLEKKSTEIIKEKSQLVIAFGVIASMLYIIGFPLFVIFFFGILGYFIWKTFSTPSPGGAREIFEFYLIANEILRDDERRWYGFEIYEAIKRGERILSFMSSAPPLVYFALGALYNKAGEHQEAVKNLEYVLENHNSDELKMVYPSPELRNYVKILRKIERDPAEAPLMSAAVRSLERARRNRGKILLEASRESLRQEKFRKLEEAHEKEHQKHFLPENESESLLNLVKNNASEELSADRDDTIIQVTNGKETKESKRKIEKSEDELFAERKPITEVLHDIYDRK